MNTTETQNWKAKIPACCGMVDLQFASHPNDEARAKIMMREAFASGASIEDVETAIKDYLASKGVNENHISEQIQYARKLKFSA